MSKPRIFIGSSVEGLPIAESIQLGLDYDAECTIWSQGVFGLSGGTLESLSRAVEEFDFAVLVLTPDDLVQKRGKTRSSPRDNVLFELGLFMGALGRERTYIVYCRDVPIDLPTDLAGVTVASFGKRTDNNLHAALGSVCTQIKSAIQNVQRSTPAAHANLTSESGERLSAEIAVLKKELAAQAESMRQILRSLTSGKGSAGAAEKGYFGRDAESLDFMQGAWRELESGTVGYARIVNGEMRYVYSFGGILDAATGEYYNFRLVGQSLLGRFRWFDGSFEGYTYLKIVTKDRFEGGWWISDDEPERALKRLPHEKNMTSSQWVRDVGVARFPDWAEEYFARIESQQRGRKNVGAANSGQ
ncbi:nucleotide-binding protein [Archangium violaceum]|uniref:TIR domain-containing protein n=1 Tax=Archangium violaceum TaxID=83451 RepID=UPI00193C19C0|nr:TIR domain-containing protein [Archangium violaceum]QRK06734.1 nucleotide-binding protein [Archangium violaceum]